MRFLCAVLLACSAVMAPAARPAADLHTPFDRVLDTYVRDGYVYYKALKMDRRLLDPYVQSLDVPAATVAAWPKNDQIAFWINAYNAIVLQTVIDRYPIKGTSPDYPANSVRQIPGGFDVKVHRVAGRSLTLDAIEKDVIVPLGDGRAFFALGRGAIGSGRLRSEVFRGATLDDQLNHAVHEFFTRANCFKIDRGAHEVIVTPLVGWRQDAFAAAFATLGARWVKRSPIEQAILGLAAPNLFPSEREFLQADMFQVKYGTFDWRLNDLTGGVPN